jgi:hypothetical protein
MSLLGVTFPAMHVLGMFHWQEHCPARDLNASVMNVIIDNCLLTTGTWKTYTTTAAVVNIYSMQGCGKMFLL